MAMTVDPHQARHPMSKRTHRSYIVKLSADGLFHHQVIADRDDLHVLDMVLKKIRSDATRTVEKLLPRYLPVPISHYR